MEISGTGVTETAALLGLSVNGLRNYLRDRRDPLARNASYPVQFALECLAHGDKNT